MSYTPLDYKVSKNSPLQTFWGNFRKTWAYLFVLIIVLVLYNFHERISLIEAAFENQLEIYEKRIEILEKQKNYSKDFKKSDKQLNKQ